jgi:hypothetical protein
LGKSSKNLEKIFEKFWVSLGKTLGKSWKKLEKILEFF